MASDRTSVELQSASTEEPAAVMLWQPADEPSEPGAGTLTAEVQRRGLVRRDNSYTSRHKGVRWDKKGQKWRAEVSHGGKRESLGCFATEAEAKARRDARCLELGMDPDAGASSDFRGVGWDKTSRSKWRADIRIDGQKKFLGYFEGTTRGEVDAALAYDRATRAVGRPEKANFELQSANAPHYELVEDTAPRDHGPLSAVGEKRALKRAVHSAAGDGRGEIDPLASMPSAGTSAASPSSPPSKKPRRTKVAAAAQPPTLTAADVVDHWLAGARLPSALRCAQQDVNTSCSSCELIALLA